jgi:hypothetical protein
MTSHNPNDVAHRYCGNCHRYHPSDDNPRYRLADVIRREVRTNLGLKSGQELRVHWETVADAVLAELPDHAAYVGDFDQYMALLGWQVRSGLENLGRREGLKNVRNDLQTHIEREQALGRNTALSHAARRAVRALDAVLALGQEDQRGEDPAWA